MDANAAVNRAPAPSQPEKSFNIFWPAQSVPGREFMLGFLFESGFFCNFGRFHTCSAKSTIHRLESAIPESEQNKVWGGGTSIDKPSGRSRLPS